MFTCKEITERASDYLDGDIGPMERLTFKLHLAMCRHCRSYVEQLRVTLGALRAAAPAAEPTPPPVVPPEIIEAFRAARGSGDGESRG